MAPALHRNNDIEYDNPVATTFDTEDIERGCGSPPKQAPSAKSEGKTAASVPDDDDASVLGKLGKGLEAAIQTTSTLSSHILSFGAIDGGPSKKQKLHPRPEEAMADAIFLRMFVMADYKKQRALRRSELEQGLRMINRAWRNCQDMGHDMYPRDLLLSHLPLIEDEAGWLLVDWKGRSALPSSWSHKALQDNMQELRKDTPGFPDFLLIGKPQGYHDTYYRVKGHGPIRDMDLQYKEVERSEASSFSWLGAEAEDRDGKKRTDTTLAQTAKAFRHANLSNMRHNAVPGRAAHAVFLELIVPLGLALVRNAPGGKLTIGNEFSFTKHCRELLQEDSEALMSEQAKLDGQIETLNIDSGLDTLDGDSDHQQDDIQTHGVNWQALKTEEALKLCETGNVLLRERLYTSALKCYNKANSFKSKDPKVIAHILSGIDTARKGKQFAELVFVLGDPYLTGTLPLPPHYHVP